MFLSGFKDITQCKNSWQACEWSWVQSSVPGEKRKINKIETQTCSLSGMAQIINGPRPVSSWKARVTLEVSDSCTQRLDTPLSPGSHVAGLFGLMSQMSLALSACCHPVFVVPECELTRRPLTCSCDCTAVLLCFPFKCSIQEGYSL